METATKETVAGVLEMVARLLELKGENPFKVRAYLNAARAVETFTGDLAATAAAGRFQEIPGIGAALAGKLEELVLTGRLDYCERLRAGFPPALFELFELQGLGPKKIKALHDRLGVASVADLAAACAAGRVAALPGFGAKTAANILKAIADRERHVGEFRFGEAAAAAERLRADLRADPAVNQLGVAGSFRRCKETIHDLDFVVSTRDPAAVTAGFVAHPLVAAVLASGATKSSVRLESGLQADLRVVTDAQFPFALNYFTGSKEHNIVMRQRALDRGWTLNEYRLGPVSAGAGGGGEDGPAAAAIPAIHEEADLYRALGLAYIEPELRENLGEFAAAERGELPALVELGQLRGTFHCHTTASDGRSSLEEMAAAAADLGLEYLGVADHSKSSFQARGLDERRLLAQVAKIRALERERGDIRLFAGVECDILRDGGLDFADAVLAQLDYVVASVHVALHLAEAEMTERIVRAVANPLVTMLGHPTGRLLLSREGSALNVPAVIEACAATGTWIELNANPKRLDLDWRWWPLARDRGVKCVINPDAHHVSGLAHLRFGVGIARKGWLARQDVINCLPAKKMVALLADKRRGR